jgi:L,D-transpeptidase YcbB
MCNVARKAGASGQNSETPCPPPGRWEPTRRGASRIVRGAIRALAPLVALLVQPAGPGEAAASAALRGVLAAPSDTCREPQLDGQRLARFYPGAAPTPLWVGDAGPLPRARSLRSVLERADTEGLPPERYGVASIALRWEAGSPTEQACLDLLLTTAFERYGWDLTSGTVAPREVDPAWHLPPVASFDAVAALRGLLPDADPVARLESLAPAHGLYKRLRAALARYRRLADEGEWNTAVAAPLPRSGDEGDRIAALRERLLREGDLATAHSPPDRSPDAALAQAVRRFQRRHGLLDDGVVGPRTLAALNTSVQKRIAQLRLAMERLRWMPHQLGRHHVFVNTAGFELAVVEEDRTVLGMRVIVGTGDQATPSFTATLTSLTINPYWNVPHRIARDSLVPKERRSPGHLAAGGFRVLDVRTGRWLRPDAASLAHTIPRLRQEPGPGNLMGRLSFAAPNPFAVFLHDTPYRSLFAREIRASSEGCVRLERAMALALHALRRAPEWTEERIQTEIDAVRHRVLTLPEPIPVHVVYLPSWVDEGGLAHFRSDHYGRDRMLESRFPPA